LKTFFGGVSGPGVSPGIHFQSFLDIDWFTAAEACSYVIGGSYWKVLLTWMPLPPVEYGYSTPLAEKAVSASKFSTSTYPVPAGIAFKTYGGTGKVPWLCGT
jgi:hypothetical protein